MSRRHFVVVFLLSIGLVACAGPEVLPEEPRYRPVVSDRRDAPFTALKAVEGGGVRFYLGETILGPPLIDVLHRELTLRAPKLPRPVTVEVTGLEISAFVPGADPLADRGQGPYVPDPGSLVVADLGADATLRASIAYRVDGQPFREEQVGAASAAELRLVAGTLYGRAIDDLVRRLAGSG